MTPDLWDSDDQMPSCPPCLNGRHPECPDLMETPPYGLHACGCTNVEHEYVPENTYVRPGTKGRTCLTCRRKWAARDQYRRGRS